MQFSLSFFALAAFAISGAAAFNNFAASCSSLRLSGADLVATCKFNDGSTTVAAINLNGCYTNNNGQLTFQKNPGNALQTCHTCSLSGTILQCTCQRVSGASGSEIDLNANIGNEDGVLFC
ncbi:Cyanovirin-N [Auricularia subglabra TFB-10046 SS5]|uniref:Cyanovirin-N n=1 Tax=Auricularia subglabra (strain TFB-10046 / SS5) TaxID=717982 RepID=J0D6Y4_AURST|nr:Cyanovirin-N [Auricularia subglabra TFB-10046 SS5]